MSLMLRKNCQEALDTFGLTNYHVEINKAKYLAIVGSCGKPLMAVTGISFSKASPSKAEIEYATMLLKDFLVKNEIKINSFINLVIKTEEAKSTLKEYPSGIEGNLNLTRVYGSKITDRVPRPYIEIFLPSVAFKLYLYNKQVFSINISKNTSYPMGTCDFSSKLKLSKAEEAFSVLEQELAIYNLEKEIENAKRDLDSCNI